MSSTLQPELCFDDPRRHLQLEGGFNVRDLGGHPTQDGRRVRWGRVFRGASVHRVSAKDIEELTAIGLRDIVDLRSAPECLSAPNSWASAAGIECWSLPADDGSADGRRLLERCLVSEEHTREIMARSYGLVPFQLAHIYSWLFRRLIASETPLLFHCAAGKDRSGVAAALLLEVLGVPRNTIHADYLLSNLARAQIEAAFVADPLHESARGANQAWKPLMVADPSYLTAMFASIEAQRDSIAQYFFTDLAIDASGLAALRANLLEI